MENRVLCCAIRGRGQSAEGKALEFFDISDLSAFTLCAPPSALCPLNPQSAFPNPKSKESQIRNQKTRISSAGLENHLILFDICANPVTVKDIAFKNVHRQRVFDILLDYTLQRPGAINRIVTFCGDK